MFYRELAPQLTGLPASYGSAFDSLTGRFVLVLEDLAVDPCDVPRHPASAGQRSGEHDRRATRAAARDILGTPARQRESRSARVVYSASGDHTSLLTGPLLNTSARRMAERTSIRVEDGRFIIDNYRAVAEIIDRQPNTVTARRRASRQRLFPQRRGRIARLAGGSTRTPRTGTGLHTDHRHDHRRPPRPANATFSPPTVMPWPLPAAPNSMPTNSGCAIGKARCMPTSHR